MKIKLNKKLLIIGLMSKILMIQGCITTPALPQQDRPINWGKSINQHYNFYQISDFVYRSEQPEIDLIPLLKQHKIDVVINLRNRDKDQSTLSSTDFSLIHIPIHTWAIDRDDLLAVMQQIKKAKAQNQKVLIHCYHGSDRTGASIAMYRIIFEHWSTEEALREMKFGGYGFHPIWINIEKNFTPENIRWIREQLSNPS